MLYSSQFARHSLLNTFNTMIMDYMSGTTVLTVPQEILFLSECTTASTQQIAFTAVRMYFLLFFFPTCLT